MERAFRRRQEISAQEECQGGKVIDSTKGKNSPKVTKAPNSTKRTTSVVSSATTIFATNVVTITAKNSITAELPGVMEPTKKQTLVH